MILYYIRHGDPIYVPDSLTPLGVEQANALAKRFQVLGLDEIYSSTSIRAQMTAQPTCDALGKEKVLLDWTNEGYAFEEFTAFDGNGERVWIFQSPEYREKLNHSGVLALGKAWYTHPFFRDTSVGKGMHRIDQETDRFLEKLGFNHDRKNSCYHVIEQSNKRIALFAHEGFGKAFLSSLLDIPYPLLATRLELGHSSVTVIHFDESKENIYPHVLQWSNDSHLYREGVSTRYQNILDI